MIKAFLKFFEGTDGMWDNPPIDALFAGLSREEAIFEYDRLFRGTDPDVVIPLWASGEYVMDATTLEVLHTYNRFGYIPRPMEGNPPDYIGNQLEFLLFAGADGTEFFDLYTIDTIDRIVKGVAAHAKLEPFKELAKLLAKLPPPGGSRTKAPPILDEPQRIIATAGGNNCGGRCQIRASVEQGCVLSLDTDCGEEPQLRACVKGRGYRRTFLSAARLRYPMLRVGARGEGRFKRISWEEAADITAAHWLRIKEKYGPSSRFPIYSTGVTGIARPSNFIKRLLALDGGYLGAYNSYSSACSTYITPYVYGDAKSGSEPVTLLDSNLVILWGHNPAETIFDSRLNYYLSQLRERGVKVIVIDPRMSDSVMTYADEWIPIVPSTDAALAAGMAHTIWTMGLLDRPFMDKFCLGFDEAHMPEGAPKGGSYESYLFGKTDGTPKTPEWAEKICGVPADTIRRLAMEYAAARPATILQGLGVQRVGNGEQNVRAIAMLTCLTGNVGKRGGGAAGQGGIAGGYGPSIPLPENPYPGQIPNFLWTRCIEYGPSFNFRRDGLVGVDSLPCGIKMLFNLAGNTLINQHSDINDTCRILSDESLCEFIVTSDIHFTASARWSDLVLPAPSVFECENIGLPWNYDCYSAKNNKLTDPLFGARFEYDLLCGVARRIGLYDAFTEGHESAEDWLVWAYEETREKSGGRLPSYEEFSKKGLVRYDNDPPVVGYERQIKEGIPFPTPSGKIEIYSMRLLDRDDPVNIPPIPSYLPCPEGPSDPLREKYPLQLIGYHTKRRCHSIHDNNPILEEVDPQRLWINPADAAARGISEGDMVEIYNDRGRTSVPAFVTERIIQGVIALAQGAWYTPDGKGGDLRGCINILTGTAHPTPVAKGNPQHTNLVEVRKKA